MVFKFLGIQPNANGERPGNQSGQMQHLSGLSHPLQSPDHQHTPRVHPDSLTVRVIPIFKNKLKWIAFALKVVRNLFEVRTTATS